MRSELGFIDVDILQRSGVNAADITKLKGAGICTVLVRVCTLCHFRAESAVCRMLQGVVMATRKQLCNIKGISEAKGRAAERCHRCPVCALMRWADGEDEGGRVEDP